MTDLLQTNPLILALLIMLAVIRVWDTYVQIRKRRQDRLANKEQAEQQQQATQGEAFTELIKVMGRLVSALEVANGLEDERIDMRKAIAAKEHEIGEAHTAALKATTEAISGIIPATKEIAEKGHKETRELLVSHVTRTVQDSEGAIRKEFSPVADKIDELIIKADKILEHASNLLTQSQTSTEAIVGAVQGEFKNMQTVLQQLSNEVAALKGQAPLQIEPLPPPAQILDKSAVEFDPYKTEGRPGGMPMAIEPPKSDGGAAQP